MKLVAVLYINNEPCKKEIKKTTSFTISSKPVRYGFCRGQGSLSHSEGLTSTKTSVLDEGNNLPVSKTCGLVTPDRAPGHQDLNQGQNKKTEETRMMAVWKLPWREAHLGPTGAVALCSAFKLLGVAAVQ